MGAPGLSIRAEQQCPVRTGRWPSPGRYRFDEPVRSNEGKLCQHVLKCVPSLKCHLTAGISQFLDKDVEKEENARNSGWEILGQIPFRGLIYEPVVDGFVSLSLENKMELKKYMHSGSETGI